jgi:hypothetical protein
MDHVIKIWSPLIQELFDSVPNLRTKWHGTVFTLVNDHADLEQTTDEEHTVSFSESVNDNPVQASDNPVQAKYQADRCKVVNQGKNITNHLVSRGLEPSPVPSLQMCRTGLHLLEISMTSPSVYMSMK